MTTVIESPEAVVLAGNRWCQLVSDRSWDQLAQTVTDDFTCRHADGHVETKDEWLENLKHRPPTLEPREPSVHMYGQVAVLWSRHKYTRLDAGGPPVIVDLDVLQVWTTADSGWLLSCHVHQLAWKGYSPHLPTIQDFAEATTLERLENS